MQITEMVESGLQNLEQYRPFIVAASNALAAGALLKNARSNARDRMGKILAGAGFVLAGADVACEGIATSETVDWWRETITTLYGGVAGISLYDRANKSREAGNADQANLETLAGTVSFLGISAPSGLMQLALPEFGATLTTGMQWLKVNGPLAKVASIAIPVMAGAIAMEGTEGWIADGTAISLTAIGLGLGNLDSANKRLGALAKWACAVGAGGMVAANTALVAVLAPEAAAAVPAAFTALNLKFGWSMAGLNGPKSSEE